MQEWQTYSTGGFPLGIDWSKPAESISNMACVQAHNCEYSPVDGAIQTVPGIKTIYTADTDIRALYYDVYRKHFYIVKDQDIYSTNDFSNIVKLGRLSGLHNPQFCSFGGDILIASGGKLQVVKGSGSTIETINKSPDCEFVSSNSGSVIVASIYGHRIYWSAIGDYNSWENNSNDSSSSQWVDIGYKDQGCICSISFLSKAMIVYKEYGRAYQVVGDPHNKTVVVYPVSETAFCDGTSISIDNYSYYVGQAGLMALVPTNTYANIRSVEVGININTMFIRQLLDHSEMWHVPSRKQLWIKPSNKSDFIYIYHYLPRYEDGRGIFTTRDIANNINDVICVGNDVYIANGNKIGKLDESIDTDDGKQIKMAITSGNRVAQRLFLLLMSYSFISTNKISGFGEIAISNKKSKAIRFEESSKKLIHATELLINAKDFLAKQEYKKILKIGGGPNRNLQIKISLAKGAISIRQFDYTYSEV